LVEKKLVELLDDLNKTSFCVNKSSNSFIVCSINGNAVSFIGREMEFNHHKEFYDFNSKNASESI